MDDAMTQIGVDVTRHGAYCLFTGEDTDAGLQESSMAQRYFATKEEAEIEVLRLNTERRSSAYSFGVEQERDYTQPGHPLQGFSIGMYSDD